MLRNGSDLTKKSYKNDIFLILFFLIIGLGTFSFMQLHGKSGALVKVRVDNKEFGSYSLNKDQTVTIRRMSWENIFEIKNGKASMIKADCPDKICVNHAAISKKGETIVCLPLKWLLKVVDENGTQDGNRMNIISKCFN